MTSFLGEILNARDMASFDEFRDTFQLVDSKISSLKTELSRALHSCFAAYDADIDRVSSWHVECVGIQGETERLKGELDKHKKSSALSADEMESLNQELSDCKQNIGVLKTLIEIIQNLELAEPETDYYISAKRLHKCGEDLSSIVAEFGSQEDGDWIRGVETAIADRVMENYERTIKEWNAKFRFEKNSLIVDPYRGEIHRLIETFHNLGYFKPVWDKFCKQFWLELLSSACTPDFCVEFKQPTPNQMRRRSIGFGIKLEAGTAAATADNENCSGGGGEGQGQGQGQGDVKVKVTVAPAPPRPSTSVITLYVVRMKKLETPLETAGAVLQNVIKLVENLSEIFNANPETMQELSEALGPLVVQMLSNKCLKTLILQKSDGNIDAAREDIEALKEFREKLWELNFRIPDEKLFEEFETNFERLYINQFRQNRLGQLRKLIRADIHHTVLVSPELEEGLQPVAPYGEDLDLTTTTTAGGGYLHRNPFAMQKYTISKSVAEMVKILQAHCDSYPRDGQLIANALNLYISIVKVPKHESEAKDFIPLTAVLIHNNSWYLSHHVEVCFPNQEDKIPMLRTKAAQSYAFMMRSIRTKLNAMIAVAMTGLNEEVESLKGNVAAKFMEIWAEFQRLNNVFFEVLPPGVLSQTLATLLDHTVNEMCSKVLSWEDISANSANELAACFTKFAEATSSFFKKDAKSVREIDALTSQVVHKWQRFRLLTFILTASMRDIQDKWVNGCGPLSTAFTADEIRKLVRALFQNTDRRAAFLASIK